MTPRWATAASSSEPLALPCKRDKHAKCALEATRPRGAGGEAGGGAGVGAGGRAGGARQGCGLGHRGDCSLACKGRSGSKEAAGRAVGSGHVSLCMLNIAAKSCVPPPCHDFKTRRPVTTLDTPPCHDFKTRRPVTTLRLLGQPPPWMRRSSAARPLNPTRNCASARGTCSAN